jgi:proteasome lid subunit RPN8/RPN11
MVKHAQSEAPNECCGMLAGTRTGDVLQVEAWFPLINEAASPTVEYCSEPRSMFAAEKERRRLELEFVAIYHSHPTSPPIPSRTDLQRNYSPDVINFIISLKDDEPEVRAWWLSDNAFAEAAWRIVEE